MIASDWAFSRATGEPEKLSKLTGDKNYKDSEVAYPDKFIDPYVGKVYGQVPITEVLTMGFQHFESATSLNQLYLSLRCQGCLPETGRFFCLNLD